MKVGAYRGQCNADRVLIYEAYEKGESKSTEDNYELRFWKYVGVNPDQLISRHIVTRTVLESKDCVRFSHHKMQINNNSLQKDIFILRRRVQAQNRGRGEDEKAIELSTTTLGDGTVNSA